MSFTVKCEQCQKGFRAPENLAGRRVKCPNCGGPIHVPALVPDSETTPPVARQAAPTLGGPSVEELLASRPVAPPVVRSRPGAGSAEPRVPGGFPDAPCTLPARERRPFGLRKLPPVVIAGVVAGGAFIVYALLLVMDAKWPSGTAGSSNSDAYQLDDIAVAPVERWVDRQFPSRVAGVNVTEVTAGGTGGSAGRRRLWVYLPEGDHADRSLPCILIAPAGTPLFCGMDLASGDQDEHYPYAQAGFAVVAFDLDGPLGTYESPSDFQIRRAYREFSAAGAGIVNARNALQYATTQIPAVDPNQVYVAGHSSAGTLALLFAEHEPRLAGCIAYAPCSDVVGRLRGMTGNLEKAMPGIGDFFRETSPLTHVDRLECPTFLFHARDDTNVPVAKSERFADELRRRGQDVSLVTVPFGDHYDSMINEGIARAIQWVEQRSRVGGSKEPAAFPLPETVAVEEPVSAPDIPGPSSVTPSRPVPRWPAPTVKSHEPGTDIETAPAAMPDEWKVVRDPSVEMEIQVAGRLAISLQGESALSGTTFFPEVPSRFVALGHGNQEDGRIDAWNIETQKCLGSLRGPLGYDEEIMSLSPDGRLLAVKRPTKVGERGSHVAVWSFETGQQVADLHIGERTWLRRVAFAAADRLITAAARGSNLLEICLWEMPGGRVEREFSIKAAPDSADHLAISPGGRYLAEAGKDLMIFDLTTGQPAGVRSFPKADDRGGGVAADESDKWECRGAAFSPDGTELVALFDVGQRMKIVDWDLTDGSVLCHHTSEGNWYSRIEGLIRYNGKKVEWFADKRGWLIAGCVAIDREAGNAAWQLKREPSAPVRLLDGRRLLGLVNAPGFVDVLASCDVSLEQAPNLRDNPEAAEGNPFADRRELAGTVRFQIHAYSGRGNPQAAAQRILQMFRWADPSSIYVDQAKRELVVGLRGVAVSTTMAKAALERSGFEIGSTSVRLAR